MRKITDQFVELASIECLTENLLNKRIQEKIGQKEVKN